MAGKSKLWDVLWAPFANRKLYTVLVPVTFYLALTFLTPYIMWVALGATVTNWIATFDYAYHRKDFVASNSKIAMAFLGALASTGAWALLLWGGMPLSTIAQGFTAAYIGNLVPVLALSIGLFTLREFANRYFLDTDTTTSPGMRNQNGLLLQNVFNTFIALALALSMLAPQYSTAYLCFTALLFNESTNATNYIIPFLMWGKHLFKNLVRFLKKEPLKSKDESDSDNEEKASTGAEAPYAFDDSKVISFRGSDIVRNSSLQVTKENTVQESRKPSI